MSQREVTLLGPADVRDLAARLGIRPTKQWGQNFVIDKGTVRRIVRAAEVGPATRAICGITPDACTFR